MEKQRDRRQHWRKDHQQDCADCAPCKACDGGDGQCLARLTLPRHRVAVEARCDCARNTGRIQQDRRRRAAENSAVIHARQQDQRSSRIAHRNRHGDHDRNDRHRPQSGQHPDECTNQTTADDEKQILERKRGLQANQNTFKHCVILLKNMEVGARRCPAPLVPSTRQTLSRLAQQVSSRAISVHPE